MKDFLIAFSASTAAIGGIIFAFLISKALGFESSQNNILDDIKKRVWDIKKINSKVSRVFISNAIYNYTEEDLLNNYSEALQEDYFEWKNKELDYLIEYLKEGNAYYLYRDEIIEKLIAKKNEFLDKKYKILRQKIYDSILGEIKHIDDLEKYEEFIYLKNKLTYTEKLKNSIKNKLNMEIKVEKYDFIFKKKHIYDSHISDYLEMNKKTNEQLNEQLNSLAKSKLSSETWPVIRITQKEIGELLAEYIYKKEEVKHLLRKITDLKNEKNSIYTFLGTAYFMIIFGVIYPLSYIKYPNEEKLDYTLYNNFFSELFSFSGIMLIFLFIIFTIFTLKIYFLVAANNELTVVFNKLKNEDFLENKSLIIQNFEFCENYIDTK